MSEIRRYAMNKSKYLLDPEFDRLIYLLKSYLSTDKRNCVLLLTALFSGARASELLALESRDLDEYEETIFIKGLKGSNDREIPLPKWIFRELMSLPQGSRLFSISYPRLVQIWQHYRPVHKKFHSLRHTFAIRLYKKTRDIRLVQVALGHRNIANTMVYADYVYSQQELRKLLL